MTHDTSIMQARHYLLSDAYQLLANFTALANMKLVEGLADSTVKGDAYVICEELGLMEDANVSHACNELFVNQDIIIESLHELRQDYTRLFTHPEHPIVDIYESTYTNINSVKVPLFMNPIAIDVSREYSEAGIKVAGNSCEPADHMTCELEFMQILHAQAGMAICEGNEALWTACEERIDRFWRDHLMVWGEGFFQDVRDHAKTNQYRAVGTLGRAFMNKLASEQSMV